MSILEYLKEEMTRDEMINRMVNWDTPDEFYSLSPEEQKYVSNAAKSIRDKDKPVIEPKPKSKIHLDPEQFKSNKFGYMYSIKRYVDKYDTMGGDSEDFDDATNANYAKFKKTIESQEE